MHRHRGYRARHGGAHVGRISRLDFSPRRTPWHLAAIHDANWTRLAVELEKYGARAVLMRVAGGHITHDQGLAALQIYVDFLSGVHSVKEHGGRPPAHRSGAATAGRRVGESLA